MNIASDPSLTGVTEAGDPKERPVGRRGLCDSFLQLPDTCITPAEYPVRPVGNSFRRISRLLDKDSGDKACSSSYICIPSGVGGAGANVIEKCWGVGGQQMQ